MRPKNGLSEIKKTSSNPSLPTKNRFRIKKSTALGLSPQNHAPAQGFLSDTVCEELYVPTGRLKDVCAPADRAKRNEVTRHTHKHSDSNRGFFIQTRISPALGFSRIVPRVHQSRRVTLPSEELTLLGTLGAHPCGRECQKRKYSVDSTCEVACGHSGRVPTIGEQPAQGPNLPGEHRKAVALCRPPAFADEHRSAAH